jgi:hypothetical protein
MRFCDLPRPLRLVKNQGDYPVVDALLAIPK